MKAITAALLIAFSASAFAAGGFDCEVSLNNGTKFNVFGCLPHSDLMGICSDIGVEKNGKKIANIPNQQIDGMWAQNDLFLVRAMDKDMLDTLVRIEFFGDKNKKNTLILNVPGAQKADKSPYTFKDVKCQFD